MTQVTTLGRGCLRHPRRASQEEAGPWTWCAQSEGALCALCALCQSRQSRQSNLALALGKALGETALQHLGSYYKGRQTRTLE